MTTVSKTQKVYPTGILGKKIGMTHIFDEDGACIPVTVIQAGPCYVVATRDKGSHGYSAVQLGFEPKKPQRVNKPDTGHMTKSGKGAFYHVKEIRCDIEALGWTTPGQEIKVGEIFKDGEYVDVTGVSKGKGFQGVVRRHGAKGQPSTRGTHEVRRHIGAIGCRKFPGRVFKNQSMPGQMGNEDVTVQNLKVIGVKGEENLILVRGGIPGSEGGLVFIRKASKGLLNSKQAA